MNLHSSQIIVEFENKTKLILKTGDVMANLNKKNNEHEIYFQINNMNSLFIQEIQEYQIFDVSFYVNV